MQWVGLWKRNTAQLWWAVLTDLWDVRNKVYKATKAGKEVGPDLRRQFCQDVAWFQEPDDTSRQFNCAMICGVFQLNPQALWVRYRDGFPLPARRFNAVENWRIKDEI